MQRWSFRTNEGIFAGCGISHRTSRTPCTKLAALSIPASVIGVPPPPYFTECSLAEDPDRGPFFIARASRHEVPTTPGNDDAYKVYDPDRVSHRQPNLLSTTPSGVVGISPHRAIPGSSSGLAPLLDTRAKNRAPLPGCIPILKDALYYRTSRAEPRRDRAMRHPNRRYLNNRMILNRFDC